MASERRRVRVRSITYPGEYINAYEVTDLKGHDLPPFTAGAHIDLFFRDGRVRQYSLCNDPSERHRYVFAGRREDQGRGGSIAIFQKLHVGRIPGLFSSLSFGVSQKCHTLWGIIFSTQDRGFPMM